MLARFQPHHRQAFLLILATWQSFQAPISQISVVFESLQKHEKEPEQMAFECLKWSRSQQRDIDLLIADGR